MKKNKTLVLSVAVAAMICANTVAFAETTGTTDAAGKLQQMQDGQRDGMGKGGKMGMNGGSLTIGASILGITEDALKTSLESGTTLYSLLEEAGKVNAYKTAYLEEQTTRIAAMVTEGRLEQTQADEMLERVTEQITNWDGTQQDFERGDMGRGGVMNMTVAASLLGLTEDELQTKIKAGENLYTLLVDNSQLDEYKTAVIAAQTIEIKQMVTDGKLDQTKADEMLTKMAEMLDSWDGTAPEKQESEDGKIQGGERPEGGMNGQKREKPTNEVS